MTDETVLTNAILVLPQETMPGTLKLCRGRIAAIDPGRSTLAAAIDLEGDMLIPGAVDLHSDNLERQVHPRSSARWPSREAMIAHDAQCAAAGVTTVLDALCVGDLGYEKDRNRTFQEGVADLDALEGSGLLRIEHFLHLRCELPAPDTLDLLEPAAGHARVRMASLMDHSPGVGQNADLDRYRALRRRDGEDDAQIERRIVEMLDRRAVLRDPNRRALLDRLRRAGVALASHDDRTEAEVEENYRDGIAISEFPVTIAAARAARARGMAVIAGAPNLVRGSSHSGNVAVIDLLRAGLVDALASDYVPGSLISAAFRAATLGRLSLPQAIALVSLHPARLAGLGDRGAIAPGLAADLVRVRVHDGIPIARETWRAGARVA